MTITPEKQIRAIRQGMDLPPDKVNLDDVMPVFTPASFFSAGGWPGPFTNLQAREIGLTWAMVLPQQTMRYIDFRIARYWESRGVDWRAQALRNLRTQTGQELGSHALRRSTGETYALVFMQPDGLGPSRLLLREELASFFVSAYEVALPEMSCAIAFSSRLAKDELAKIRDLIDKCYENGTRPLAPGVYSPEDILPRPEPA